MSYINLIGWIGNLFFVLGAILLAKKKILGFYSNALANLIYIYFAILIAKDSLIFLSIFLILVNAWGIYNWRKTKKQRAIKKVKPKNKKELLFIRILNKVLKLANLKIFELAIGFVKGFSIKIEFFKKKE